MKSSQTDTLQLALQLGIIAGLRSAAALVLISNYAMNKPKKFKKTQFSWLASENVNMGFRLAAGGEMIGDKLPFVPDRTTALPLVARIASGALAGGALSAGRKEPVAAGAIAGGVGAVIGSYAGTAYRHFASGKLHVPNVIAGLIEDGAAIWYGLSVLGPQIEG